MTDLSRSTGAFKAAALVGGACLVAFLPVFRAAYMWDDPLFFTRNRLVSDLDGILRIWTRPSEMQNFDPLVYTLFWLEYRIWGLSTAGSHGLNLAIHAANAFMLFLVLRRIHPPVALTAALLFALHPTRVEVVALISQRKDTLSGFFYFLAALRWLDYEDRPTRAGYAQALLLFVAALLCKAVVCTLPVALFLASWARAGSIPWNRFRPLSAMLAVGLAFAAIAAWWERVYTGASPAMIGLSPVTRLQLAGRALWFYLGKTFWPSGMVIIYPKWPLGADCAEAWFFAVAAAVAALVLMIGLSFRARLALVFTVVTIAPALGLIDHSSLYLYYASDHYMYHAAAGAFMLLAAGPIRTLGVPLFGRLGFLLALAMAMCVTWNQSRIHQSAEAVWRHNIRKSPELPLPWYEVGILQRDAGDAEAAAESFAQVVRLDPDDVQGWYALAELALRKGDGDRAMELLRAALDAKPAYPRAANAKAMVHDLRGQILARRGETEAALADFRRATEIYPGLYSPWHNMGTTLLIAGRAEEALEVFASSVRRAPGEAGAHNGLGQSLLALGREGEARAAFERAVELDPRYVTARLNLAMVFARAGRFGDSERELRTARTLAPNEAAPVLKLAAVLSAAGRRDEALHALDEFLRLHPDHAEAVAARAEISTPPGP